MYFPYLRGRQNELLALNELAPVLGGNRNVVPIIEPTIIRQNSYRSMIASEISFVLITNPAVGRLANLEGWEEIERTLINGALQNTRNYYLGILIGPGITLNQIENYLKHYPDHRKVLIHRAEFRNIDDLLYLLANDDTVSYNVFSDSRTSIGYRNRFAVGQGIILKDGFVKMARNADYPEEEFFCDIHYRYRDSGYAGFGDFATIGDSFSEGGQAPLVVALHLAYTDGDNVHMAHLCSDRASRSSVDTARKFSDALENLINFVNRNGMAGSTIGIREFEDYHARAHYPGLGAPKKASIKHHIELISTLV